MSANLRLALSDLADGTVDEFGNRWNTAQGRRFDVQTVLASLSAWLGDRQSTPAQLAERRMQILAMIAMARQDLEATFFSIAADSRREPRMPVAVRLVQRGAGQERHLYLRWRALSDLQTTVDGEAMVRTEAPHQLERFRELDMRINQAALIQTILGYVRAALSTHGPLPTNTKSRGARRKQLSPKP